MAAILFPGMAETVINKCFLTAYNNYGRQANGKRITMQDTKVCLFV